MATITINVPNEQLPRIQAAFEARYGVTTLPQLKARVIQFVKDTVASHEREQAEADARAAYAAIVPPDLT